MYEELEPIDENLKYDFDYQQVTHLRREVLVKPVSSHHLDAISFIFLLILNRVTLFNSSVSTGPKVSTK